MKSVLFYATSPVHIRNLRLLMEQMSGWKFCVLLESRTTWERSGLSADLTVDLFFFQGECLPRNLDPKSYSAVVFSTVQCRPAPLNLLLWAMSHSIPTVAIEEVNQCAWHGGLVNNYLAPVDRILVASVFEKNYLEHIGARAERVEVTGWPFFSGETAVTDQERRDMKTRLGLEPGRPVVALTLPSFDVADESESRRIRQFELASEGLPTDFQLAIKPHPADDMDVLRKLVSTHVPQAVVVEGSVPVDDLLVASDILLNRGNSQTAIDALLRRIPVLVLDTGNQTPFHQDAPEAIAKSSEDIERLCREFVKLNSFNTMYGHFISEHIPFDPFKARENVCNRISEVVSASGAGNSEARWFELALLYGWQIDRRIARILLKRRSCGKAGEALKRLFESKASREDLSTLLAWWPGDYSTQILRSLWCDQLVRKGEITSPEGAESIDRFFCSTNLHLFCPYYERWGKYLIDRGRHADLSWLMDKLNAYRDRSIQAQNVADRLRVYSDDGRGRRRCQFSWFVKRTKERGKALRRYLYNPLAGLPFNSV